MELSKGDSTQTKGLAAVFMVLLHLFCIKTNLPFSGFMLPSGIPLVYYIGLFGDQCVAMYCFCSGYAHYLIRQKHTTFISYACTMGKQLLKFLIQFWIILLFVGLIGIIMGNAVIPKDFPSFFGNFFLYRLSYCGPWWFVLTYALLVLASGGLAFLCKKIQPVFLLAIFGAVYFVCYVQRFHPFVSTENSFLMFWITQITLFGNSVLPYMFGMVFRKYELISKARKLLQEKNISRMMILIIGLTAETSMLLLHSKIETLFVAPFIAVVTIIVLNTIPKPKWCSSVLGFCGKHSTNIWLVHFFFIQSAFPSIAYLPRYPVLIFLWVMALSVGVSYVINFLCKPVQKLVR